MPKIEEKVTEEKVVRELKENEVKLSDGRIVELTETTGADEMVVAAELGNTFTPSGGGAVIFQSCLIAKSIKKIDDQKVRHLRGFADYRDFLSSFRSKDWNRVRAAYTKLNGEDEQGNV